MKKNRNLIVRTVTGLLFVVVMVGGMVAGPVPFAILFALITALTTWEFCTLVNRHAAAEFFPSRRAASVAAQGGNAQRGNVQESNADGSAAEGEPVCPHVNRLITTVTAVYFFFAVLGFNLNIMGPALFVPFLISLVYLMVSELYLSRPTPLQNWAFAMMAWLYVALPFSLLSLLAFRIDVGGPLGIPQMTYSWVWPLSVFILLWMSDAGAYLVGSMCGRHKLFPRISPHKTWEGSVGGGLLAVVVSQALCVAFGTPLLPTPLTNHLAWTGLALVVVVFGTWGDLAESLLKRSMGIKDSGSVLPGHGGMLDRFDSSLLAIPAALVYIYMIATLAA